MEVPMGRLEKKILAVVISMISIGALFGTTFIYFYQKDSIYEIAKKKMLVTARVVTNSVERTMLEGKAEVARAMVSDLRTIKGVKSIVLLNHEGREAFHKGEGVTDAPQIERLSDEISPFALTSGDEMVIYSPLRNTAACQQCHTVKGSILGAVKISLSLTDEREKVASLTRFNVVASVIAILTLSFIIGILLRRIVIHPMRKIENASRHLSEGDLSFRVNIDSSDEIGQASTALKDALLSISSILQRVRDVSKRVSNVSHGLEKESKDMVENTKIEAEAIDNISSSIEELNASVTEISDSTHSLASSSDETASAIQEMSANIEETAQNSNELSGSVESLSSSIEELSSSAKEIAESSDGFLKAADDTLSTIEEITASIKEIEANAKDSAKLSGRVMHEASTYGMDSIEKTMHGMERIKISVETTAEYIKRLEVRSEEIGKIVTVIDEIAENTTLLALNAAILASQAGEHGKGFSVVADEIKDLAERTSFSTQEISTLIDSVQREVSDAQYAMNLGLESVTEGITLSSESSEALRKIVESAKQASTMSSAIEHSTSEQAQAAKFVTESMESVRNMALQIAKATSEQLETMSFLMKTAEKVNGVATHLKTAIQEQSSQSRLIMKSTEVVSEKSQHIANALNEQRVGSEQIKNSVQNIAPIPLKNRNLSFKVNNSSRTLLKDVDLIVTEMSKFRLIEAAQDDEIMILGVVPHESPAETYRKFAPLTGYLSGKLGKKVELKVGLDFRSAIHDIGTGVTQMCYMGPSTYIKAHSQFKVKVLVKTMRKGSPFYHSVIISKTEGPIKRLEDIKGRSFAFGDPDSISSHILPRSMLTEGGVDLSDLLFYNYLGHHDDVAMAVLSGEYDAGAVMESIAEKYKEKGLRLIKYSNDIPEFNISVTANITEDEVKRIKSALLSLNEADSEVLSILQSIDGQYTGLVEASDKDYDGIRDAMSRTKLM
jgi:phosphate/phosphite/phosphonate ABC transporter binding protein